MGVQVPLGHMLTYMLTAMHVVEPARCSLRLIDGHGLISICQEHDIPARILGLGSRKHTDTARCARFAACPCTSPGQ